MSATFVFGITEPLTLYSPSVAQAVSPVGFDQPYKTVMALACRLCCEDVFSSMPSGVISWLFHFPFVDVEFCHAQMDGIPLSKGVF
jgi:hypothetical protein